MDCFYVQVEQRANPALYGQPCVVVQYRTYKGGAWVYWLIISLILFYNSIKLINNLKKLNFNIQEKNV